MHRAVRKGRVIRRKLERSNALKKGVRKTSWMTHFVYAGLVFVEGHGFYRFAAIGMAGCMIAAHFLKIHDEED